MNGTEPSGAVVRGPGVQGAGVPEAGVPGAGTSAGRSRALPTAPDGPSAAHQMVEMLGLRKTTMRVAVVGVLIAYIAVGLILPEAAMSPWRLAVSICGSLGLVGAVWLTVCGDEDPVGLVPTVVAVTLGALSGAAVWWSLPTGPMNWVRPSAPMVLYAVAMCLLVVRGRARWAWSGLALVAVIAALAMVGWGWSPGAAMPIVLRMFLSLAPVTLMMLFVRPLLRFMRVLDRREIEAVAVEAAQAATQEQRRRRLAALGREVSPFLEHVVAGRETTADEAARAHLLEAELRDEVRGTGWMSPSVRRSAGCARERGVIVRLFDDRGDRRPRIRRPDTLQTELVDVLDAAQSGSVTARLLPVDREVVAVIAMLDGPRSARSAYRIVDGVGRWRNDDGGAPLTGDAPPA